MGKILAPKDIKSSYHGFEKNVAETSQTQNSLEALRRESNGYFSVLAIRLHKRNF